MNRPLNPVAATLAGIATVIVLFVIVLIGLLLPFGDTSMRWFLWVIDRLRALEARL